MTEFEYGEYDCGHRYMPTDPVKDEIPEDCPWCASDHDASVEAGETTDGTDNIESRLEARTGGSEEGGV